MKESLSKNKNLWFKAKHYGWGWYPCSWQGLLITLIYIALIFIFGATIDEGSSMKEIAFTFVLPLIILTIVFIKIAYKTGEKPCWRWGK